MNWNDLTMWMMTLMVLTLTGVLYVRVDIHDWGMVGFTIVLFGMSVLMVRWVMRAYGWIDDSPAMLILWRFLVLIGAPITLAGFWASVWRDPPPRKQVAMRLGVLAALAGTLVLVIASV